MDALENGDDDSAPALWVLNTENSLSINDFLKRSLNSVCTEVCNYYLAR